MRRALLGVVIVAVLVGSGGYAYAQSRDSAPTYRTATATLADVQRTLDLSGTVSATGRRDLSFGTAGTVRSVSARLGQHVRSGQVLARLDPTALDAQVTSAVATLAKAEAQLDSDEASEVDAATATATAAKAEKAARSAQAKAKKQAAQAAQQAAQQAAAQAAQQAAQQAATLAVLRKQQAAVTSAQTDAGHAMNDAQAALGTEQQACAAGSGAGSQACADAVAAVEAAQATVAANQQTLQTAIVRLSESVGSSASKGSSHGTGSGTSSGSNGKGGGSGGSGGATPTASTSSSGGFAKTVTAATLAQDQAQIDTAQGDLSQARAARGYATLQAPYAGQVVQSDIARQDLVSAGTTAFVLVGRGVTEVSTTLTSSQVADVHAGQQVKVTPAGWSQSLTGTATLVGLLADTSGNHTLTVTVQSSRTVAEGSTASLSIVVGTARNAVSVPTSAVDRIGSRATVEVLRGKTVTRTLVTPGVVGSTRTSIASGLAAGTTVVLADLGAALPSSSSTTNGNRFGGGGFGGGVGGGFGGPGSFTVRRQTG